MSNRNEKILLALSGGVDSSVAALLLKRQGFSVSAAVFVMSPQHLPVVEAAKRSAKELDIPLHVVDLKARFQNEIILPFCEAYTRGETPSPCVICNRQVKFAALCETADRLGIPLVASGHYTGIRPLPQGPVLAVASQRQRDQSYMLYRLSQQQLSRLVLPLAALSKEEIRELARGAGLSCSQAPDSEENCFISGSGYADFLEQNGFFGMAGNFLLPDGRTVPHRGTHRYTIGQRKGLGIGGGEPLFVQQILPNGDIRLCRAGGEFFDSVTIRDMVLNPNFSFAAGEVYDAKIRSAAKPSHCTVYPGEDGTLVLRFALPVRAAAAGQSAVLYREDMVAGGGVIQSAIAAAR